MLSIETHKQHKETKKLQKITLKKEKMMSDNKKKRQLSSGAEMLRKRKNIKKDKVPTGEKDLFFEIRNDRKRNCIICGKIIKEAKTRCFAHILAKGQRPKYRLNKNNIVLVCSIDCHHKVDSMIVGKKKLVEDQLLSGIIPDIKGLI